VILCQADHQHPRLDEASLLPLSNGRLYLAYSDFYDANENDEGAARIMGMWSDDGGATWSRPVVAQENIGRVNVMEPSLLQLPSGRVLMTFMRKDRDHLQPEPEVLILMVKHSDDGCRTWSVPLQLCAGADDEVCHDRLIRHSSGRLILPGGKVWLSDDEGVTWRQAKNAGGGGEPSVAELADGALLMLWRSGSGSRDFRLHAMRSRDAGETWTAENEDWGPASSTAPCILRRVPGSDDLLLVWNHNSHRTDLASAVSHDGGRIWENFRVLEPAEGWPLFRSHQYPSLAFHRGNAHLTYREVHKIPGARAARLANGPGKPHRVEMYMHLIYRRLPIQWFYETTTRRKPIYDLRKITQEFFFPDAAAH
jgi:hypothetical protein